MVLVEGTTTSTASVPEPPVFLVMYILSFDEQYKIWRGADETAMLVTIAFVEGFITAIELLPDLDTYTRSFDGEYDIPNGKVLPPIDMVVVTVFVDGFITETLLDPLLVTYNLSLEEQYVIASGLEPTVIVATSAFVDGFITDTVVDAPLPLATYIRSLDGQ